jgi:TRAP-type mannitol/chloroaromatic compound transport system substrate-binding protein
MSKQDKPAASRRRFLSGATAAAAGTAALGFPMIAKSQGPISLRWQSTWPAKDIFHEYANDYAKKVNDMTGWRPQDRGASRRCRRFPRSVCSTR